MSVLNDVQLKSLIAEHSLVIGMNPDIAVQSCGIDLSIESISRFYMSQGTLGRDNKDRRLPEIRELKFDAAGWMDLIPGVYSIRYAETVNIPKNLMAIGRPRSSVMRMGCSVESSVFDPGYSGKPTGLLIVSNDDGLRIQQGARVLQLIFMDLSDAAEAGYSGVYQRENL